MRSLLYLFNSGSALGLWVAKMAPDPGSPMSSIRNPLGSKRLSRGCEKWGDRSHQALAVCRRGPRVRKNEGSPRVSISRGSVDGVDAGCLRFAVRLTPPHARLASGCWPCSTGWDWLPTRLRRKVSEVIVTSRPPFPSFSLAQYEIA